MASLDSLEILAESLIKNYSDTFCGLKKNTKPKSLVPGGTHLILNIYIYILNKMQKTLNVQLYMKLQKSLMEKN